ncbi:Protein TolB [Candidatus Methanoperedenaceae archaeon GB50]|nr:Protein TolB [Candidatus Methanoperedenaceae archaeon GB50]CAD7781034.1 MAG: Protein TolB [Candidatus Methanoperedenaceae archaeon GB50]
MKWQGISMRKSTGGRLRRARGGKKKYRLLRAKMVNVVDRESGVVTRAEIETVVENLANQHYVMRKGVVFGILVMLFVAMMASVVAVVADEGELLVSIKGYSTYLSPDFKKVAYLDSLDDGDDSWIEQLWVMNIDESDLKKLDEWEHAFGTITVTIEGWNPDGQKLLYSVYNREDDTGNLWVVNSDGTGKKKIAEYASKHSPVSRWSPDGSKIAFESGYYGEGILVVNSDGSNKTLITRDGSLRYWTPDGKKIIFLKYDEHNHVFNFWEIDLDSGISKNIYSGEFGIISPDRSKIASQNFHGGSGIWISDIDGSNLKELSYYTPSLYPCWSPDSKRIAFIDEGIHHGIWVINSDGSNEKKVKEMSYEDLTQKLQFVGVTNILLWSKDGSKIAYAMRENETTNIYTINVGKSFYAKPSAGETPTEKQLRIPDFEAVFTIAGLLAVTYLMRRRK